MLEKFPGESAVFDIDCSYLLATAETITGTPTMAQLPVLTGGDALTFGAPVVNTEAVTYADGRVAAIGKVVQVRISGGTSASDQTNRTYAVTATFSTSAGNTLVAKALLDVLNVGPN